MEEKKKKKEITIEDLKKMKDFGIVGEYIYQESKKQMKKLKTIDRALLLAESRCDSISESGTNILTCKEGVNKAYNNDKAKIKKRE